MILRKLELTEIFCSVKDYAVFYLNCLNLDSFDFHDSPGY